MRHSEVDRASKDDRHDREGLHPVVRAYEKDRYEREGRHPVETTVEGEKETERRS